MSTVINSKDFEESKKVTKQGGYVAKVAHKELEAKTFKNVVTSLNAKTAMQLNEGDKKKPNNNK